MRLLDVACTDTGSPSRLLQYFLVPHVVRANCSVDVSNVVFVQLDFVALTNHPRILFGILFSIPRAYARAISIFAIFAWKRDCEITVTVTERAIEKHL